MAANCQAAATGLSDNSTSDGQTFSANSLATASVRRTSCSVLSRSCHRPLSHFNSAISRTSARGCGASLQPLGHLEASAALRNQADKAFLSAKLGNFGDRADTEALLPTAHFRRADQHHAEPRFLASQQLGKHDQVALLEDAQAQRHIREQHRVEREHCQNRHAPRQPSGSNSCRAADEPAHSSRSRITPSASSLPSRVKTSMLSWTTARRLATRSTRRLFSVVVSSEVVRPSARRARAGCARPAVAPQKAVLGPGQAIGPRQAGTRRPADA